MATLCIPRELAERFTEGNRIALIASFLGPRGGYREFCSQHIPTSMYCDPTEALHSSPGAEGRNPLPHPRRLSVWVSRWGIEADTPIVVYDEGRGLLAARAWWLLRYAGFNNVEVLSGGLAAWEAEGLPTIAGPGTLARASSGRLTRDDAMIAGREEARAAAASGGLLIDARGPARFAGYQERRDLKAGHIPGAVNVPARSTLRKGGGYRTAAEIRDLFFERGIDDVKGAIVYSGSGYHSSQLLCAMAHAGLDGARHFVGGWSQWSLTRGLPLERGGAGPDPGHKLTSALEDVG